MAGTSRGAGRISAVVVALAVVTASVTASAQHGSGDYRRAGELREAQRYDEALALYEAIHQRTGDARALAQRGVTEAQMGRWVAAEEHLAAALATGDRWVRHHREALQAALEQTRRHVGDLTVTSNVPARLSVNGVPAGSLPRGAVRVAVGPAVIDVDADGYEPLRQTVEVQGASTRVEVSLVRRPAPPTGEPAVSPAVAAEAASAPRPSGPARVDIVVRAERPDEAASPLRVDVLPPSRAERPTDLGRVFAWVSAGAGVLFLGAGVVGLVVGGEAAARWNSDACQPEGSSREDACGGDRSTAESMRVVAVAGFAGGAAAAVASTVLFLTSGGRRATARERAGFRCGGGPGDVGLACGGVF